MRLTLRTMLAYLDNVLEPADGEVLGQKINESDFASALVQRIKVVTKKLRMDAPKLDGKGMGNDANTVSEYLDSALPQDRVGDFERVCLESDKHLCEVAACHQVLTLVLGSPADVPVHLRERVYALGHPENAAAHTVAASITPPPVQAAGPNGQPAAKPALAEVPEYLRAGRGTNLVPILATVAAAFLVAVGGLWMIGAFRPTNPLMRWMRGNPQVAANAPHANTSTRTPTVVQPPVRAPSTDASKGTTDTASSPAVASPAPSPMPENVTPAPPPAIAAIPATDVIPAAPMPAVTPENPGATVPAPAAPAGALPPVPPPEAVATVDPAAKTARKPLIPPGPEVKPPPVDVGRYTSDGQVLATYDPAGGLWKLKAPLEAFVSGERLISLPTYRPQLTLPGVQVTFAGEGNAELAPPADGISRLSVDQGKLLVVAVGAMNSQIDLDLSGIHGLLTLVDADSAVAIKVLRWLPPGMDPAEGPGAVVVELFNTHGRVTWTEAGQAKVEIPTHKVLLYAGANPPELQGPFIAPDWIDAKSVTPIDRQASLELEGMLAADRPLSLSLQEALQFRKVEIRSLAARCLACLNEYEPILKELSDPRQFSYWGPEFDTLRRALHHSPATAAAVQAAVERLRAAEAKDVYRLLWAYSPEQLERGSANHLVKLLEHDQMDMRVLAYENLVTITGAGELYRPERTPAQQRSAIQNWKERLAKGTIAYKLPPTPLENYNPLAGPAATEIPIPPRGAAATPLAP